MKSTIGFWSCLIIANVYVVGGNTLADTISGLIFLVLSGINFFGSLKE